MNSFSRQALSFVMLLCILAQAGLAQAEEKRVGVLLSREISPVVSMVEGLESRLNVPVQRFFLDPNGKPYSLDGRSATLDPQRYDVLVAVGPEALIYLNSRPGVRALVYGMVLNPEKMLRDSKEPLCGVSLNIPAEAQFASILGVIPAVKRLGVLFDSNNNSGWFKNAAPHAAAKGFELVPLQVTRLSGKLEIVGEFAGLDAILFIPDKSIISKAVIQYVIKQGAIHGTPVIGYNQFFYDSGAALSFLIDYHKVGIQVARQVEQLLAGGSCSPSLLNPRYEMAVNEAVWRVLKKGEKSEDRRRNPEVRSLNE